MKALTPGRLIAAVSLLSAINFNVFAAEIPSTGMPPLEESAAYKQFMARPVTELSKIIFLIDRFGESDIQVVYEGHEFAPKFVARVARWFLATHYKGEGSDQWIMKWCNTSIPGGDLIWGKMSDGTYVLSRELLTTELTNLNEAMVAIPKKKTDPPTVDASAAVGNLVEMQQDATKSTPPAVVAKL